MVRSVAPPPGLRRALRWLAAVSAAAALVLFLWGLGFGFGHLEKPMLTFVGIVFGALLLDIDLGALSRLPAGTLAALVPLAASQACYYLLVWTGFKGDSVLWRNWWMSMVASVTSTHLLVLLGAAPKGDWLGRAARWGALLSGLLLMALGLQRDVFAIGWPFWAVFAIPAVASVGGSFWLWRRRCKADPRPLSRQARIAWSVLYQAGLVALGIYIGRAVSSREGAIEVMPSALTGLSPEQIDAQVDADLNRLKAIVAGMEDLGTKSRAFYEELRARLASEGRSTYYPDEEDLIRWHFVTYLSHRAALLRIVATYSGFQSVREPESRARCFMLGFAAAVTAFEYALRLIDGYGRDSAIRRKLNEAEPIWGLPERTYDRIYDSVTNSHNVDLSLEMRAWYDENRVAWLDAGVWPRGEFGWLDRRIQDGWSQMRANGVGRPTTWLRRIQRQVKSDAYSPVYAVQSFVSTWIGDTRVVESKPLIAPAQIDEIGEKLQPGDILLERRNWYLSNAFLPGFWPHAALYVGTIEDLKRLGIADHAEVRARLQEYLTPDAEGHPRTVIESVSEGVIFNSLRHSMHADHVAVLRPRVSQADVADAIVKAFSHQGKPYDFEFDFATSDKLVCTELVYRAYQGKIRFELVRVMGRDTLPALEIVKKFARERGRDDRALDFVAFLDGLAPEGRAAFSTEEELCRSVDRPRAFNE
jgi:hypothetical protein